MKINPAKVIQAKRSVGYNSHSEAGRARCQQRPRPGAPAPTAQRRAGTDATNPQREGERFALSLRSRRVTNTLEYAGFLCTRAQKVIGANYDSELLGRIIFHDLAGFRDRTV